MILPSCGRLVYVCGPLCFLFGFLVPSFALTDKTHVYAGMQRKRIEKGSPTPTPTHVNQDPSQQTSPQMLGVAGIQMGELGLPNAVPSPSSSNVGTGCGNGLSSEALRLQKLKHLNELGLITEDDYSQKKAEILAEL